MATCSFSNGYKSVYTGERRMQGNGYTRPVYRLEHRLTAERALGKPLPSNAVVHHVDGDVTNGANGNLVICQDQSYHDLLHRRARALKASGNANYLKCAYCKDYDDPRLMVVYQRKTRVGFVAGHSACKSATQRRQYAARVAGK